MTKLPGLMTGLGLGFSAVGFGAGPNSAVGRNRWCVFVSIAMVLAPFRVAALSRNFKNIFTQLLNDR